MNERVCKCKCLCTVNIMLEWLMRSPTTITAITLQQIKRPSVYHHQSICLHQFVLCLGLQSLHHPQTGLTTICCCSSDAQHYLPRWSESVGSSSRGVHRIQLPSITHKYSPVKRLLPFKQWHKNKSLIFTSSQARQISHFYVY